MTDPGPGMPQIQYFQPRGAFLPPRAWRRHDHGWVWVVSVLAALLLAAVTAVVLVFGIASTTKFTASGYVRVDCATKKALDGGPIGRGSRVRLYDAHSGSLIATTSLDRAVDVEAGKGACYEGFRIHDVRIVSRGYLVEIDDQPGQLVSRDALEAGTVLE
ncbi:hypothetical protein [Gordonia sp. (in: high G+C Gram-positive bacteria)]|uniref:hypothetical protein n=1 Tax=Gordonia sp. (in: high G+C Gram-positive bacteria) TaxID=84139 RepID=UPI00261196FE|nr:hypothetical protein [Gordonia sp. (in: high G+C Gram-positive bacteria)]